MNKKLTLFRVRVSRFLKFLEVLKVVLEVLEVVLEVLEVPLMVLEVDLRLQFLIPTIS